MLVAVDTAEVVGDDLELPMPEEHSQVSEVGLRDGYQRDRCVGHQVAQSRPEPLKDLGNDLLVGGVSAHQQRDDLLRGRRCVQQYACLGTRGAQGRLSGIHNSIKGLVRNILPMLEKPSDILEGVVVG